MKSKHIALKVDRIICLRKYLENSWKDLLALLEGNTSITGIIFLASLFLFFRDNYFELNSERITDKEVVYHFLLEIKFLKVLSRYFPLTRVERSVSSEGERVRKFNF